MRLFIKNLSVFAVLVIIIATLIQAGISWRIKGKSVTGFDNLEQTGNVNADLVLMGNSRCSAHFDPHFFDTAFGLKAVNIGVSGHGELPMTMLRLKDYLSRNKPPKYAILNFDPTCWPGTKGANRNFALKYCFSRYAFLPKEKDKPIVNYFRFNAAEKYIPLYAIVKYKLFANCISLEQKTQFLKAGYEKVDMAWDTIIKPVKRNNSKNIFEVERNRDLTYQLKELHKLCSDNSIKLLCLQTPVHNSVYVDSEFARPAIICAELNIPFVDANYPFMRSEVAYFFNRTHMNTTGVHRMNSMLYKDSTLKAFLRK